MATSGGRSMRGERLLTIAIAIDCRPYASSLHNTSDRFFAVAEMTEN
ncbi:hypothetical protein ACE1CD_34895 [Aerosakkonema sp. BLCC-F183]